MNRGVIIIDGTVRARAPRAAPPARLPFFALAAAGTRRLRGSWSVAAGLWHRKLRAVAPGRRDLALKAALQWWQRCGAGLQVSSPSPPFQITFWFLFWLVTSPPTPVMRETCPSRKRQRQIHGQCDAHIAVLVVKNKRELDARARIDVEVVDADVLQRRVARVLARARGGQRGERRRLGRDALRAAVVVSMMMRVRARLMPIMEIFADAAR